MYMIPEFDNNGNLPPGIYRQSLDDFKQKFVIDFFTSSTRHVIYNGYISYCKQVVSFDIVSINWITGSFTTNKLNPEDIDIVVHFDPKKYRSMIDQLDFEIKFQYAQESDIKKMFYCHAFYVPTYPENDPRYILTVKQSNMWKKFFSTDKNGNDRGLIEFDLSVQKSNILMDGGV